MNSAALATFLAGAGLLLTAGLAADPLSKHLDVDFFRDVPSRNLSGLAARSDGRLVDGPVLTELAGEVPAELLWRLEPAGAGRWLLGTGPNGRIFELTIDLPGQAFRSHELVQLDDPQIFALHSLADGTFLAGSSPKGRLALVRQGKVTAEAALPADSIFDIVDLPAATGPGAVLVATGNPGRIFRVDLAVFAATGIKLNRLDDRAELAARGISEFAQIADRNVRRLARLADGRIAAGSSPRGNLYVFPPTGGAPILLEENREAEVTDLLAAPNGDLFATITFSSGDTSRADRAKSKDANLPPPVQEEHFNGRSVLMRFPSDGFPELLTSRVDQAFYHLARHGNVLLVSAGDEGQLCGYDLDSQMALDFAGSPAARLNDFAAVPGSADRFLILHNNAPGLALLDFTGRGARHAETGELDLGLPSRLGALRFDRLRDLGGAPLTVEIRTSFGSEEREGWSPWTPLTTTGDGWRGAGLRGRFFKLRLSLPAGVGVAQLGRAALYYLPQDRRPQIQDFRIISPNFALVPPAAESAAASTVTTLNQLVQGHDDDGKRRDRLLAAQVVPSPGNQAVFWSASDPDGDNLVATFSIRRDGDPLWTDVVVDTTDNYAQFDVGHLPEGIYFTRLVVRETAPRPAAERLSAVFETDDLLVDHSPPAILEASVRRSGDLWLVSVHGRDALSLLDSIEADFNNSVHEIVEQPADGIRDGREETFVLEEPVAKVAGATSVEVTLNDAAGNSATRRIALPR